MSLPMNFEYISCIEFQKYWFEWKSRSIPIQSYCDTLLVRYDLDIHVEVWKCETRMQGDTGPSLILEEWQ